MSRRATFIRSAVLLLSCVLALGIAAPVRAQDSVELTLSIKDHRFQPAELRAPAGKAIALQIKNLDATAAEFESKALRVEKVIGPRSEALVRIRPQKPGRYSFFDEFHPQTQGVLVVE
jgi:hypothetical protein